MKVVKRDGRLEPVQFDKIARRIKKLCYGTGLGHDAVSDIAKKVIVGLYDGVSTEKLDRLAAETAASMATNHPDYSKLAARIEISNLYKKTSDSFANTIQRLYKYTNPKTNENASLIDPEVYQIVKEHAVKLDETILSQNDFEYDYFAFKTLERSYLMKIDGKTVERPQYMLMRVAIGIHRHDISSALATYKLMSNKYFTHATPTLFNAGTPKAQLSSCFLLTMQADSIEGIYNTLKQCAKISQYAGGIGLNIHNIRSAGSYIKGTGGISNGIVPMLRNFDMTARYVDQGGGKRKGSFAIYLEPWHADIFAFLDLKKNHGKEELRARDLFYALWIPDLFMKRVEEDGDWSLFSPNEAEGLADTYGDHFERLYTRYEAEGKAVKKVKAQEVWFEIIRAQIETGTPYMLYKDACNKKSNQKNLGTIKCSNLCTEIVEYSSPEEIAVCNLASIGLAKFVDEEQKQFDHQKLYEVTKHVTRNLNKVIDVNYYALPECERSNLRHRPMGIGVQGLADTFLLMRLPFDSPAARKLNTEIFETIYFAALEASNELAAQEGPYTTFGGSPASKGVLQFDMWGVTPKSGRWAWERLRKSIQEDGLRNSLLVAPMPTASTSQILGNNECFEPYTSNIYVRRVLSGEFIVVNKHLLKDLIRLGIWNKDLKNKLIAHNGSVQKIDEIPQDLKELYKTVWEISQRSIIDMAADRGAYIDQSQSLNLHVANPSFAKLTSMHFYGWKKGLKTGMYYLRMKAAADAIQFTVDKTKVDQPTASTLKSTPASSQQVPLLNQSVPIQGEDDCDMCSG